VTQIYGGGDSAGAGLLETIFVNLNVQVDPTVNFNYALVGGSAGARGVLCDDGSQVSIGGVDPATVHYGATASPLTAAQIPNWNASLNVDSGTGSSACATGSTGTIGMAQSGPLMQIPTFGMPVTIAYNVPNQTANGGLTFTDAQLCGIFSAGLSAFSLRRV